MTPEERHKAWKSWIAEFYPEPAEESDNSELQALTHSLQKWIGLRKENLEKHGWKSRMHMMPIEVNSTTCALCHRHCDIMGGTCKTCPLYIEREAKCYEAKMGDLISDNPYNIFLTDADPEPMINLIQICLDKEKERLGLK